MAHDLRDTRVHYERYGRSGPRVLLIHPIGFDHHTWEDVIPHLEDAYEVVALDLPGHGLSEKPADAEYTLPNLARRVERLLDELDWPDAAWIANSIGGGVSLAGAVQSPERVRALGLINSVGFRPGLPFIGRLGALPLLPSVAGYTPPAAMRLGLDYARCGWGKVSDKRSRLCLDYMRDPEGRAAFFRTLKQLYGPSLDELAERYRQIHAPTLVIHGENDPLIRMRHAEKLAETIPTAELVRIPKCGHFPQEECPSRIGPQLRSFLDRVYADMKK